MEEPNSGTKCEGGLRVWHPSSWDKDAKREMAACFWGQPREKKDLRQFLPRSRKDMAEPKVKTEISHVQKVRLLQVRRLKRGRERSDLAISL